MAGNLNHIFSLLGAAAFLLPCAHAFTCSVVTRRDTTNFGEYKFQDEVDHKHGITQIRLERRGAYATTSSGVDSCPSLRSRCVIVGATRIYP